MQLKYNNESVFFRTEGLLSEESRSNGIQPYGMKNLTGEFHSFGALATGLFSVVSQDYNIMGSENNYGIYKKIFNTKNQMKEYSDDIVVRNRKIRVYNRIV